MSVKNGDKARFGRQRQQKMIRRMRTQDLMKKLKKSSTEMTRPIPQANNPELAPGKPSGARGS